MSLSLWHKCEAMPACPPIHYSEEIGGWFIAAESHDAEVIYFCPWCGEELKHPHEYYK